jgi:transcription antitermination factor NusG
MHEHFQEVPIAAQGLAVSHEGSWFAVRTKPRHEKTVARELETKGITAFLPLYGALHQWSDRKRQVDIPLFAGYVFVRFVAQLSTRISVLRTNGIAGFVGARGVGVPIPDEEIEAVRTILVQKVPFTPHPFLSVGQKVRICGGSLDGIEGILQAKNGDHSLIVSVESIQRSLAIRIAGYQVEAA